MAPWNNGLHKGLIFIEFLRSSFQSEEKRRKLMATPRKVRSNGLAWLFVSFFELGILYLLERSVHDVFVH